MVGPLPPVPPPGAPARPPAQGMLVMSGMPQARS